MRSQRSSKTMSTWSPFTVWYNFIKMHKTLKMTPAMAAGVSQTLWSMDDLCEKMDAIAPKPGKRGPYKKSVAV